MNPKFATNEAQQCASCEKLIHLVPTGQHYKWVTNPNDVTSWRCGNDPEFPLLGHKPNYPIAPRVMDTPQFEEVPDNELTPEQQATVDAFRSTIKTGWPQSTARLFHAAVEKEEHRLKHELANTLHNDPRWPVLACAYEEHRIARQELEVAGSHWGRGWWLG